MNLEDARALVDFHYWARDRLLDAIEPLSAEQLTRDMGGSFRSVRDTLAHIYSAEWIWLSRWRGASPAAMLAPDLFPDLAAIRTAWSAHEAEMRAFLSALDEEGLHQRISYRTTAGQTMSAVLRHLVQHVVNHASYHRGQVTTLLRQLGAAPPKSTDLVTFYRERAA